MATRSRIIPQKPHFFKPILPGFIDGVKIPTSFLKYLGGKISEKHAVLLRGAEEWRIRIRDQCLKEGWKAFAVANKLEVGDFVVFEHEGDMVFEVLVFDTSHCEREFPSTDDDLNGARKFKAAEEAEEISRSKKVKSDHSEDQEEATTKQISGPYFISTLNSTNLRYHRLHIPMDFASENGLSNRECNMVLRDQRQRSWSVGLRSGLYRAYIQRGWKRFINAQELKEGDEFVLELIENGETPIFSFYGKDEMATGKLGEQFSSEPDNYFVSTIKPCNLKSYALNLPSKFAKRNGLTELKEEMILKDDRQREWKVRFGCSGSRVMFSSGWVKFFKANGLKVGDRYKFEIIKKGKRPVVNFHSCALLSKSDVKAEEDSPTPN